MINVDQFQNPSSLCFGSKYYPEAFEAHIYEGAVRFSNDEQFYNVYKKFILLVLADTEKVKSERVLLIAEIERTMPKSLPITKVTWCALCLATDRYFDEKAKLNNWTWIEKEEIKARWYEIISKAFVPVNPHRIIERSYVDSWREDFSKLITRERQNIQSKQAIHYYHTEMSQARRH